MKDRKAQDIMTAPLVTVRKDMLLTEVIRLLVRWHISGAPVVEEGDRLVGIITEHDLINFALSGEAAETRVEEAMTRDVVSFPPDADIETLVQSCAARRIRRVPIVQDGRLIGIVSRHDILREMDKWYSKY
jgi:CBS domain-containing protein